MTKETKQKNFSLIGEAVVFFIPKPLHLCFFSLHPISRCSVCPRPLRLLPNLLLFSFPSLFPRFFIKTAVSYSGLRLKLEARQQEEGERIKGEEAKEKRAGKKRDG